MLFSVLRCTIAVFELPAVLNACLSELIDLQFSAASAFGWHARSRPLSFWSKINIFSKENREARAAVVGAIASLD